MKQPAIKWTIPAKRRWPQFILLLYVASLSIMRFPRFPGLGGKVQGSDLILLLLVTAYGVHLYLGRRSRNSGLKWMGFLIPAFFLPSFFAAESPLRSAIEWIGIASLAALYFLVIEFIDTESDWWRLVRWGVGVCTAVTACVLLVHVFLALGWLEASPFVARFETLRGANPRLEYRLAGLFRHPAMYAVYLHISLVFCLIQFIRGRDQGRSAYWMLFAAILFFVAALLTKARINAGIAITLFLIFSAWPIQNGWTRLTQHILFVYAGAVSLCAVLLTVWWVLPLKIQSNPQRRTLSISVNTIHQSYFIHHKASWDMFWDHPAIGVGMGLYNVRSKEYVTWEEARRPFQVMRPTLREKQTHLYMHGIDPHSTYMGWAAETGVAGLFGILTVFGFWARRLYRSMRDHPEKRFTYWCFLSGLLGFLFNGYYIDIVTLRPFWFFMAMGMSLTSLGENS